MTVSHKILKCFLNSCTDSYPYECVSAAHLFFFAAALENCGCCDHICKVSSVNVNHYIRTCCNDCFEAYLFDNEYADVVRSQTGPKEQEEGQAYMPDEYLNKEFVLVDDDSDCVTEEIIDAYFPEAYQEKNWELVEFEDLYCPNGENLDEAFIDLEDLEYESDLARRYRARYGYNGLVQAINYETNIVEPVFINDEMFSEIEDDYELPGETFLEVLNDINDIRGFLNGVGRPIPAFIDAAEIAAYEQLFESWDLEDDEDDGYCYCRFCHHRPLFVGVDNVCIRCSENDLCTDYDDMLDAAIQNPELSQNCCGYLQGHGYSSDSSGDGPGRVGSTYVEGPLGGQIFPYGAPGAYHDSNVGNGDGDSYPVTIYKVFRKFIGWVSGFIRMLISGTNPENNIRGLVIKLIMKEFLKNRLREMLSDASYVPVIIDQDGAVHYVKLSEGEKCAKYIQIITSYVSMSVLDITVNPESAIGDALLKKIGCPAIGQILSEYDGGATLVKWSSEVFAAGCKTMKIIGILNNAYLMMQDINHIMHTQNGNINKAHAFHIMDIASGRRAGARIEMITGHLRDSLRDRHIEVEDIEEAKDIEIKALLDKLNVDKYFRVVWSNVLKTIGRRCLLTGLTVCLPFVSRTKRMLIMLIISALVGIELNPGPFNPSDYFDRRNRLDVLMRLHPGLQRETLWHNFEIEMRRLRFERSIARAKYDSKLLLICQCGLVMMALSVDSVNSLMHILNGNIEYVWRGVPGNDHMRKCYYVSENDYVSVDQRIVGCRGLNVISKTEGLVMVEHLCDLRVESQYDINIYMHRSHVQGECSVCMTDTYLRLPCNGHHSICLDCTIRTIAMSGKCPLCRFEFCGAIDGTQIENYNGEVQGELSIIRYRERREEFTWSDDPVESNMPSTTLILLEDDAEVLRRLYIGYTEMIDTIEEVDDRMRRYRRILRGLLNRRNIQRY